MKVKPPKDADLQIKHAKDLAAIMQAILKRAHKLDRMVEHFWLVGMDQYHQILFIELVALGGGNSVKVQPKDLFRVAVLKGAFKCMLVHNHPSGDPEPSEADKRITHRLRDALSLVDIRTLDHVVVASEGCVSLAERGYL